MVRDVAAQIGVRTRGLTAGYRSLGCKSNTSTKKRSRHIGISSNVTNRCQQRVMTRSPEKSVSYPSAVISGQTMIEDQLCSKSSSLDDQALMSSSSCCSSNGSSSDDRIRFTDLEQAERVEAESSMYYSTSRCSGERDTKTTPTSGQVEEESTSQDMDSTAQKPPSSEMDSFKRSEAPVAIRVTDEEVEQFLCKIEEKISQHFKDKYNFDFDKGEPLEGRYKWVRLN